VYDAGTSSESYEWLDVGSCSKDELRVLEEKVNVLDLPSPPGAQVRSCRQHQQWRHHDFNFCTMLKQSMYRALTLSFYASSCVIMM
jgi:hypothetical protein